MDQECVADEEGPHFSQGAYVVGAVMVSLASILLGLALVISNPLASGFVLAAGAVADGHIARRIGAGSMTRWLYGLAVLVLIAGALLSWMSQAVR